MPGCRSFHLVSGGKGGEGERKRGEVGKKRGREGREGKGEDRGSREEVQDGLCGKKMNAHTL